MAFVVCRRHPLLHGLRMFFYFKKKKLVYGISNCNISRGQPFPLSLTFVSFRARKWWLVIGWQKRQGAWPTARSTSVVCCHLWSRAGTTIKTVVKRGFLQRKRIYFYLVKSAHGARFLKKRNIDILPLIFIEQFVCGNVSASRYSNAAPMASLIFMSQNRIPSARSMDDKDRPRICRFESFHRVSSTAPLTIPPKKTNVSPKKKKRSDEIL